MLSVFGFCVFAALFGGALWRQACRWRHLAEVYSGHDDRPLETRTMQSAVLMGLGGYNALQGILQIGVHETGISLRVMPVFSLFHAPLFIPYGDIRGWTTSWYLNAPSIELEFRRTPAVKMIVPAEQAEWMKSRSSGSFRLHASAPPDGMAGRGWHAFTLVHVGVSAVMVMWLLVSLLGG
jgi:hypothetical protein